MRTIERQGQFKKDYKREARGQYRSVLVSLLGEVLNQLAEDIVLETKYRDHVFTSSNWKNFRSCHIKPDLIIIYRNPNNDILQFSKLGPHLKLRL